MKKGLLLMTALLFISGASMAQKVVNVDGKAVIDNRAMPTKAITTEKKARVIPVGNPDTTDNIASTATNKTVSRYFEVAKENYIDGGLSWEGAINGCAGIADDGKGLWRLPTQRELMLIWILHVPLKNKITDFVSFYSDFYWSAMEGDTINSWCVSFSDGVSISDKKTYTKQVRCVRDVTP